MSLRGRFTLVVAATVAVTLLAVGVALQVATAAVLIGAVDDDLRAIAASVERDPRGIVALSVPGRGRFGGAAGLLQVIDEDGIVQRLHGPLATAEPIALPVDDAVLAVARGAEPSLLRTDVVEGVPLRMLVVPISRTLTLQVARPVDEIEAVVRRLRWASVIVGLLGVAGATLGARRLARRALQPVTALTAAVEDVRGGADLTRPFAVARSTTNDEVARLATAFDGMRQRLDASRRAQERLTADAAHELRTPLTSLTTNVEVLAGGVERLDPAVRRQLAADVLGQVEELTVMVDGLVALARVDTATARRDPVDLGVLVADVVDTARRRHPQRASDLTVSCPDARAHVIVGDERELALAVSALLDNAVKYAPHGPITVAVTGGDDVTVTVSDCGPGVPSDDLPHVFERFFRSAAARSSPGAGLGLALVERVAHAHGGSASARTLDPSGLTVSVRLPSAAPHSD